MNDIEKRLSELEKRVNALEKENKRLKRKVTRLGFLRHFDKLLPIIIFIIIVLILLSLLNLFNIRLGIGGGSSMGAGSGDNVGVHTTSENKTSGAEITVSRNEYFLNGEKQSLDKLISTLSDIDKDSCIVIIDDNATLSSYSHLKEQLLESGFYNLKEINNK